MTLWDDHICEKLTVCRLVDRKRGASLALYIAKRKPMKFPSADVRSASSWTDTFFRRITTLSQDMHLSHSHPNSLRSVHVSWLALIDRRYASVVHPAS